MIHLHWLGMIPVNLTVIFLSARIITQLETLKKEVADVQKKVDETDVVMAEVDSVLLEYLPLSTACSSMYFTLESLNQVAMGNSAIM